MNNNIKELTRLTNGVDDMINSLSEEIETNGVDEMVNSFSSRPEQFLIFDQKIKELELLIQTSYIYDPDECRNLGTFRQNAKDMINNLVEDSKNDELSKYKLQELLEEYEFQLKKLPDAERELDF